MVVIWGKNIKELVWKVISDKMNKTIVVSVERVKMHPLYKKRYTVQKKFYVHDATEEASVWDTVKFRSCKPISKLKKRNLLAVQQKAA